MPTIIYDTIDGAEVGLEKGVFRGTRTGIIKGLNVLGPSQDVLARALAILPADGSSYSATYPLARLTRHVVSTFKNRNDYCRFALFYETPAFAKPSDSGAVLFTLEK